MNIVIPDNIEFTEEQEQKLRGLGADLYSDVPKSDDEIIERIKNADIITANYIDITPSIIDAATNLKYIVAPAVGFEWIDVSYAKSKGIKVVNCPTFNSQSVAEMAFALTFAASRKVIDANADLRSGNWEPQPFTGMELSGKAIGLIGHGNIGKRIEKIALAMGMKPSYIDSKSTPEEIDQLIASSDFLVLCVQLNEKTKHMIDERRLSLMKKMAYLVNVSRGAIVDQPALLAALRDKKIAGAALDVFDGEPLIGTPSEEILAIAKLSNVTATPHTAANTIEAHVNLGAEVVANIESILAGTPDHIVND